MAPLSRSYTRRWSASLLLVTVKKRSFGRVCEIARSCCGTPTMSGRSASQVPASIRVMKLSRSCPTKIVPESGAQVMSCGCRPTGTRATSTRPYGSRIDTLLPMRFATAIHFASGETARLCGILPTAMRPTTVKRSPPSSTQTESVVSDATNARSARNAGGAGVAARTKEGAMKSGDVDGPAIGMGMSTGCADVGAGAPPQLASTSAAKRPAHRGICARRYGEIVSGPCLELAAVSAYLLLKLAHVFLAIVAIGTNLSYSLWLRAGEREPAHLAYTIRGIRAIDRRLANPADPRDRDGGDGALHPVADGDEALLARASSRTAAAMTSCWISLVPS